MDVVGVDFSGARDAGRRIWIAEGVVESGRLGIRACFPALELPGSGRGRDEALAALASFVAGLPPGSVVGIDVPFGLPAALVAAATWRDFVTAFRARYSDPGTFRRACVEATVGRELKRETDIAAQTPFSPYNLRLYRQTYHALCSVVGPLVAAGAVRVAPMETPDARLPAVVEVCPASTLKRSGLYRPYKGPRSAAARAAILGTLEELGEVAVDPVARTPAIENAGGDALDSIVAAVAARRSTEHPTPPAGSAWRTEGFVFV